MQTRLDTDLEEEQDDGDLGEEERLGIHLIQAEHRRADDDAPEDLANNRRLSDPFEDLVSQLRREQQPEQLEQDLG